jgi:succinoglycan biosynthesis protein ExoM
MAGKPGSADIDVCVCTYRRPAVAGTLASIAALEGLGDLTVRVVLADNAETPDAAELARQAQQQLGLEIAYRHAPSRNISVARNACLDAARGDWIAFLDDDETASAPWLAELLAEAQAGRWDAVLGPVDAIYPPQTPAWIRAGDFHSTRPVWVRGAIETGYCGNVLIRRALVQRAGLRFDPALGRSGGEDVDFFYRLREAGGRIGFAPRASAVETMPADRLALGWLLRRRFRSGQTHGHQLRRRLRGISAVGALALASLKAGACAAGAAAMLASERRRNGMLARAALHCGVVCRLAGVAPLRLY